MRAAASADLIDDREYAAPPELVFEAWTKAEHFARWFAPDNVEVPLCEIDAAMMPDRRIIAVDGESGTPPATPAAMTSCRSAPRYEERCTHSLPLRC